MTAVPRRFVPVALTGRLYLFELGAGFVGLVVAAFLAIWASNSLAEASPGGPCIRAYILQQALEGCRDATEFLRRDQSFAVPVMQVFGTMPFVFGGFLGAIAISRDIDEGATPLIWWLHHSRVQWYVTRVAILGAVLLIMLGAAALMSDWLHAAQYPHATGGTFQDYGVHGAVLVSRSILAFAIGVVLGAVSGRQLVALIASAGVIIALSVGLGSAVPFGEPYTVADAPTHQATEASQLGFDLTSGTQARRSPDGRIVTEEVALLDAPEGSYGERLAWVDERYAIVDFFVPPSELGAVTLREGVLEIAAAAMLFTLGGIVVRRRRPY